MAGVSSDGIGLLFKIKAKDEASEVIDKLLKNVTSGSQDIKGAASEALENYSAKVSALGIELGTLTGGAAVAATALFEIGQTAIKVGEYLFDLAKTSAEFASGIYDATVQTGLSAEAVSALALAAAQSDVSLQGVILGLTQFEKKLGSAKEGGKSAIEVMNRLFGADWKAQTADAETALENVFKRISSLKDPTERVKAATDFAGRSGAQFLKIIDQTGGSFIEFKKRAEEAGKTLSGDDVKAADDFADALKDLEWQGKILTTKFAVEYMPQITGAIQKIESFFASHQEGIKSFGTAVSGVIVTLGKLVQFIADHPVLTRVGLGIETMGVSEAVYGTYKAAESIGNQSKTQIDPNSPEARMQNSKGAYSIFMPPLDGNYLANQKEQQEEAKTVYRQSISDAQELSAEAKKNAEADLENLKRTHELSLTETAGYAAKRKTLAKEIYDAELDAIQREREAVKTASEAGVEDRAEEKYNKLKTRELDAKQKYEKALQTADDEAQKEKIKRAQDSFSALENVQKILDDSKIAEIRNAAEKQGKGYADAEKQITEIQKAAIKRRYAELGKEFKLAAGDKAAQKIITDELLKLKAEETTLQNEGARRYAVGEQKENDLLAIGLQRKQALLEADDRTTRARQDKFEQEEIAAAEDKYKTFTTTFEEYQEDLQKIAEKYFTKRQNTAAVFGADSTDERHVLIQGEMWFRLENLKQRKQLATAEQKKELDQQIKLLEAEIDAEWFRQQKERSAFEQQQHEKEVSQIIERRRLILETIAETKQAERDLADFRAEQERKSLENTVDTSTGKARLKALLDLRDFDIKEIQRQAEQRQIDYQSEVEAEFRRVELEKTTTAQKEEAKAAIIKLYQNKALQSEAEFQAARHEIEVQYNRSQQATGSSVLDEIKHGIFGEDSEGKLTVVKNQAQVLGDVYSTLSETIKGSIDNMVGALEKSLEAYFLYGTGIGKALKMAAAQELAHIAAVCAIKALYQLAEGFALLFIHPAASTSHFIAAGIYTAAAGGAGWAAQSLAGSAKYAQTTATAKATYDSSNSSPQAGIGAGTPGGYYSNNSNGNTAVTREEDRFTTVETVRHEVNFTDARGRFKEYTIQVIKDDVRSNGDLRELIGKVAEQF